jgi:hypothetical protein
MDREFTLSNQRRLAEYQYNISLKNAEVQAAYQAYQAIVTGAQNMVASVKAIMGDTRRGPDMHRYADGGDVVRSGPAIVHAGELIINRGNRQMAENLIGGSLTQSNLLSALRGGSQATINNHFGNTVTIQQVAQMLDYSAQSIMKQISLSIQAA